MEENIFSGFEAVAGQLSSVGRNNVEPSIPELPEEDKIKDGIDNDIINLDDPDADLVDPNEIIGNPTADDSDNSTSNDDNEESTEESTNDPEFTVDGLGEYESDISEYVAEQLFEKLGWDRGEDDKFESVEAIVDYLSKIVEENSVPNFANEEIEKLNDYVNNGGDLKNFYSKTYSGIDTENLDLENELNQKAVIKEHLKNQGYTDVRISKLLQRYEDAGTLSEEAEDALELVKEYNIKKEEKLLAEQKDLKDNADRANQEFITNVESSIKDLKSVRGIEISDADRKKLTTYMLKVGPDGLTQYQKDYQKDFSKNFIESAYLTMKGDSLFTKVEKKVNKNNIKTLKQKLQSKGKRGKVSGEDTNNSAVDFTILSSATNMLRKP